MVKQIRSKKNRKNVDAPWDLLTPDMVFLAFVCTLHLLLKVQNRYIELKTCIHYKHNIVSVFRQTAVPLLHPHAWHHCNFEKLYWRLCWHCCNSQILACTTHIFILTKHALKVILTTLNTLLVIFMDKECKKISNTC